MIEMSFPLISGFPPFLEGKILGHELCRTWFKELEMEGIRVLHNEYKSRITFITGTLIIIKKMGNEII
jgi:hypothetical protein